MWAVKIDITVALEGCPESGLGAVDYRRRHGLPEAPTSKVQLAWAAESDETLCRQFGPYLTDEADLVLASNGQGYTTGYASTGTPPAMAAATDTCSGGYGRGLYDSAVPPALAGQFLAGTADAGHAAALVAHLVAEGTRVRDERRQQQQQREADEAAERERRQQQREAAEAERRKALAERQEALAAWARDHGSERVRLQLDGGFPSWAEHAREEFAAAAADRLTAGLGLVEAICPDGYAEGDSDDRTNPTVPEMRILAAVRERGKGDPAFDEAKLVWAKYDPEPDPDGYDLDDEKPISRGELAVWVKCPDGTTRVFCYLVPADVPAPVS